jgi:hypothetical protein
VPGHVAQHHRETAVGQLERVVEVAAGRVAVHAHVVPGGDAEPGQLRQMFRQHAALQHLGGAVLGLEPPGPLGRLGDQLRGGGEQRPFGRQPGVRIAVAHGQRAVQGRCPQRHRC